MTSEFPLALQQPEFDWFVEKTTPRIRFSCVLNVFLLRRLMASSFQRFHLRNSTRNSLDSKVANSCNKNYWDQLLSLPGYVTNTIKKGNRSQFSWLTRGKWKWIFYVIIQKLLCQILEASKLKLWSINVQPCVALSLRIMSSLFEAGFTPAEILSGSWKISRRKLEILSLLKFWS